MTVDPSTWFKDASGAVVDPTDAEKHDALALAICASLDTQPQSGGPRAQAASAGKHGGDAAGKGGGNTAHCVELAGP